MPKLNAHDVSHTKNPARNVRANLNKGRLVWDGMHLAYKVGEKTFKVNSASTARMVIRLRKARRKLRRAKASTDAFDTALAQLR